MTFDAQEVYKTLKLKPTIYQEDYHCPLVLEVMSNPDKGTLSAFCCEARVSNHVFYKWLAENPLFYECYYFGKMVAKRHWEKEGLELKNYIAPIGQISYAFEHWKMVGWSQFGISNKNSRVRLDLNPKDEPTKHYAQLLKQAASGDFTAGEIKQLMEAINVGLNTQQVITLQKQIDELKSDIVTMGENSHVQNTFSNQGIAEEN